MKTISSALSAHIQQAVTTLATCWKVTRKVDGAVLGFTTCDKSLVIGGVAYEAASGFTPTAIQTTADLSVDNLDVDGILSSPSLTEEELVAGKWDYAEIEVFKVNYEDLTMGTLQLRKGHIGEIKNGSHGFSAELRGIMQAYANVIGELSSPGCRANLGDGRCKTNLTPHTIISSVTVATDRQTFTDTSRTEISGWFDYGILTWSTGANAGLSMEVKTYVASGTIIALVLPMPYAIAAGDAYSIVAGCDKLFTTCVNKFSNAINFRGEPHLPGQDKALNYGTR